MTNPQTIEIIISPTGDTQVTTKGFAGNSCRQASAFLEEALGNKTGERLTTEFFAQAQHEQRLHEGS